MKNRILGIILVMSFIGSGFNFLSMSPSYTVDLPTQQSEEIGPATTGPDDSPGNINPLTGLPVDNPENLKIPPALVSITNWPVSARPQAGLSYSPFVFELYIGEGMSRFLAMFYGEYPSDQINNAPGNTPGAGSTGTGTDGDEVGIGPIRSGRLPYEHLRTFYNGFLVMASAYKGVAANLGQTSNIFGSDSDDINSAMIGVHQLEDIAKASQKELGDAALGGLVFDPVAPAGGSDGQTFWFIYNAFDMVKWQFDETAGAYNRYQDRADGVTFDLATDRLNGEALTYENVILLFANHRYCTETAFDVDLMYVNRAPALLFRDGKMYPIYWTTKNGEYERTTGKLRPIRFMDANGDPFPLKPGQTWVHLAPLNTRYWESVDSDAIFDLLNKKETGSGVWVSRFYSSLMVFDQGVCNALR